MEQNLKSQQNLVHYLDIVNNTVAKVQKFFRQCVSNITCFIQIN